MNPWLIYLWQQADVVRNALSGAGGMVACGALLALMMGPMEYDVTKEYKVAWNKICRRVAILAASVAFLGLLIPKSNTIALMYVLPRVAQSEAIQRDLPEIYDLAIGALKSELGERVGDQ